MPFLRFSRDKRGYETTSLVHAFRHRGRAQQRILYWFRTPPGVKVGRPALDEDAIRWIEEHNPDIQFNWQKILQAQPPPPPAQEDVRRGKRREKPPRQAQISRPSPAPPVPEVPEVEQAEVEQEEAEDALEQITHPDAEELTVPPPAAVASVIAPEQLIRMRARYAELLTRITERGGDAARIEELRGQADALNPDTWVTEEEVRKGAELFEPRIRELRSTLGLRRRRRSRRGGRRRRRQGGGQGEQPIQAPASGANPPEPGAPPSNSAEDDGPD